MANQRPLKLTNAALLQTLKNAILVQNRLEFQKKSKFWPSKWRFFKNVVLEPIWVGHGWSYRMLAIFLVIIMHLSKQSFLQDSYQFS
jgi:hypothetical protein